MKNKSYLLIQIIIVFFLLFSIPSQVSGIDQASNKILATKRAKQDDLMEPRKFEFSIGQKTYFISNNGVGVLNDSNGKTKNFTLSLDPDYYVVRVDYLEMEGDMIFIYGVRGYDDEQGTVIRMNKMQMKIKWIANIPGFNIGESVMRSNCLYLSAIGFIGKLDLDSGTYIWRHDSLYNKKPGLFNSFERPMIKDEIIEFKETLPSNIKGTPISILVDDKTGQVISPHFEATSNL